MPVILQRFGLTVVLKKLVHRENSQAGAVSSRQKQIDLTGYLSENDSIQTVKSTNQPGGGFTISFVDQLAISLQDTLYALIEPMDMIEIRAARHEEDFVGQTLPLIMRGYVSSIQRNESIGDDGTPLRQVIVRGIDGGKLWQINQVLFEFLQASGKAFLDPFSMQAAIGIDGGPLPVGGYMQKLVDYMNTKVEQLSAYGKQLVPKFKLESTVKEGQAFLPAMGDKAGSLWNYVEAFVDRPWNEVFIVDEEAQPVVVFRPVPYKDLAGKLIMDGAADPGSIDVSAVELISIAVTRSDARVANFFWVPPGNSTVETGGFLTAAALANALPVDADYGNNSPTLYGEKMMNPHTSLMPSAVAFPPEMLPIGDRPAANGQYISWHLLRTAQLKAMNRDNSVLEEGLAVVNGKEALRIGCYMRLTRGTVVSEAYITNVAHAFSPLRSWVTTLSLERGTGFYNRDKAGNIPFFAEGRGGPYQS